MLLLLRISLCAARPLRILDVLIGDGDGSLGRSLSLSQVLTKAEGLHFTNEKTSPKIGGYFPRSHSGSGHRAQTLDPRPQSSHHQAGAPSFRDPEHSHSSRVLHFFMFHVKASPMDLGHRGPAFYDPKLSFRMRQITK